MPTENDGELTVFDYLSFLLPRLATDPTPPIWPPDMFALSMGLVSRWGLYTRALEAWPPASRTTWAQEVRELGLQWKNQWPELRDVGWGSIPALEPIVEKWNCFWEMKGRTMKSFEQEDGSPSAAKILEIAAIADEACCGFGIIFHKLQRESPEKYPPASLRYHERAEYRMITSRGQGATLGDEVQSSRVRILPKMHTPRSGLTIRSLSHNLALCESGEIRPAWHSVLDDVGGDCLNLLLVPIPATVFPVDFRAVEKSLQATEMQNMPTDRFGFFEYDRARVDQNSPLKAVPNLLAAARESVGTIHGIVFPELALSADEFKTLKRDIFSAEGTQTAENDRGSEGFLLVSGVGSPAAASSGSATCRMHSLNQVRVVVGDRAKGTSSEISQDKHHRWRLDESQIRQYGIGSSLDPEREWWEHICVKDRRLAFVSLQPWLVVSVLICEDLARPDPAGELVRAVGPNLVIALLMDGPQIKERWSARYATTLADDPGSSVLSLTSIGMSKLSRSSSGQTNRSRIIALWKDAKSNSPVEIELPDGYDAVVLSLTRRYVEEFTADGRGDGEAAGYPALSGVHPIRRPSIT